MFTLKRLWDSLARVADSLDGIARTLNALSAEVQTRCSLPGPLATPALPEPTDVDNRGQALEHGPKRGKR
jgi:hypothetical protein